MTFWQVLSLMSNEHWTHLIELNGQRGREIGFKTLLRSGPIIQCAVEFYLLQGLISLEIL